MALKKQHQKHANTLNGTDWNVNFSTNRNGTAKKMYVWNRGARGIEREKNNKTNSQTDELFRERINVDSECPNDDYDYDTQTDTQMWLLLVFLLHSITVALVSCVLPSTNYIDVFVKCSVVIYYSKWTEWFCLEWKWQKFEIFSWLDDKNEREKIHTLSHIHDTHMTYFRYLEKNRMKNPN